MLADDLPEGITAEQTATVTMTVQYVFPLKDGKLDVFGRSMTEIQRLMEAEAFDVEAHGLTWTTNRECPYGHVMPVDTYVQRTGKRRMNTDDDCETCIDRAVAEGERRAEGGSW